MKSVLMSVRPKWCELIASGRKTIEVRKTKPKLQVPFKVYVYCTKPSKAYQTICGCICINTDELYRLPNNEIKYGSSVELMCCNNYDKDNFLNGKVIGEFVCDDIDTISVHNETLYCVNNSQANKLQQMCLSIEKIKKYLGQSNLGYNWHISDLKIYDKPKELKEFYVKCDWVCGDCNYFINYECTSGFKGHKPLKRSPQSWCYCEEVSE